MDIKTIATGIGLVITIAGLFVYQGQLIERVQVLESKVVDTKPIEKEIIALPTMATRLCDNKTWDSLDIDHLRQIIYYAFLEEQKKAKDEY